MKKIKIILKVTVIVLLAIAVNPVVNAQGCMEPSSDGGVTVAGYIQPQFEFKQTDDAWNNSFTFNRARVGFLGNVPYDFSYYFMAELSKFKPDGSFMLDAFITYSRFELAKVSFGQFKVPFSLEQNTPCQSLHTIYRSRVVEELAGPQRDLGVMLFGGDNSTMVKYSLALVNDYKRNSMDENSAKSIKGRLVVNPTDFLSFGGNFGYGKTGVAKDNVKTRLGGELELRLNNFLLQGEYIWGKDTGDYTTGGGCDGTPLEFHEGPVTRGGFFVTAAYMTRWSIQPVIKIESFDGNMDIADDTHMISTIGMNYFFNDWTRLQVNYMYKAEGTSEVPNDAVVVQLQIKF